MSTPILAVDPARPDVIPCFDPATREPLGTVAITSPAQVKAKLARAREAQRAWAKTSFASRRAVLQRVLDRLLDDEERLVELVCRDSGKTRENALVGEVWTVCEKLRWTIAQGETHLRPERVSSGLLVHKRARLEFHPLGVVGAIVPWNYPLQNVMNAAIPALMAGNAYVVKPSEWVAWSSEAFVALLRDALRDEGHDPELVQIVQGDGATGRALIEGGVDVLVFIGSVENGRRVLSAAASKLTPVILELGGKDPFIVCEDAHLDAAVAGALSGSLINCGQNCVASERFLVRREVAASFEGKLAAEVRGLRQGPSRKGEIVDVGAMTTPLQLQIVERLVNEAVAQGARVVAGGKRVQADRGEYFAPTILADVTPSMSIMHEETFGPVMLLCTVESDAEAIEIANATSFGLGSTVFSNDRARARRIASALEAGMTGINDFGGMTYMAQDLTFGGVKHSGFGRINGREGLRALCNTKAVLDDRLPFTMPSKVLPVTPKDFETAAGALDLIYGRGLRRRARGLRRLVGSLLR
ncbi:MAG: aldehyde dehydrogenase family protein [Sandaracinaceae bacterium]|nr:aldehyde dehydrogenase family protein [Sandaracinaceae bacterium]